MYHNYIKSIILESVPHIIVEQNFEKKKKNVGKHGSFHNRLVLRKLRWTEMKLSSTASDKRKGILYKIIDNKLISAKICSKIKY